MKSEQINNTCCVCGSNLRGDSINGVETNTFFCSFECQTTYCNENEVLSYNRDFGKSIYIKNDNTVVVPAH